MALPKTGVRLVAEGGSSFFDTLNRASGSVDRFQRDTQSASAGTIAFGVAIGNLAAGALTTVAGLLMDAGRAAVGFVGGSISMAAELEAQMSGVKAVLGASNEELDLLNELVIDLGIDPNLKVSSVEAAQAIEMLAKNGVELEDILGGVARQTVFLSNATGSDMATAADLATSALNIFGFEADQMGRVVNGASAVINSSTFDVNDYALALANGGATAAALGVEFEDFNTAIAAISPSFSSGQTAGTALKNLLLRLVPATESAEDAMKDLGLITADGANAFFDAEGNMRNMGTISEILMEALSGLSEEQKTSTLRTIFGNDAMGAAIALAQVGGDEFANLAQAMSEVDAEQAAADRMNNFAGAMEILNGVIESVRMQIGDFFLPILKDLAGMVANFIDQNADGFINFFKGVAGFIEDFVSAIKLGEDPIGALAIAFQNIGADEGFVMFLQKAALFVGTFIENIKEGRGFLTSFIEGLLEARVDPDIVLKIAELGIKVGEFIKQIVEFVSEHKDAFIGAIAGIGIAIAGAGIVALITAIIGVLGAILSPVGLIIAGAALLGAAWAENWGGIRDLLTEVWYSQLQPALIDLAAWLKEKLPIAIQALKDWWTNTLFPALQDAWAWFKEKLPIAIDFLIERFQKLPGTWESIKAFWNTFTERLAVGWEAWTIIFEEGKDKLGRGLEFWKGVFEKVKEDWALFVDDLGRGWLAWEVIFSEAKDKLGRGLEFWQGIFETVKTNWGIFTDDLSRGWEAWGIIFDEGKEKLGRGLEFWEGVFNRVKDNWTSFTDSLSRGWEFWGGVFDRIKNSIITGLDNIMAAIGPLMDLLGQLGDMIPPVLQPGSPTPFERGLRGIADAMTNINSIGLGGISGGFAPPATAGQINQRSMSRSINTTNNVNFTGNYAGAPNITDRDTLVETLGTL